tara:strand:- start:2 stop:451 length:450 start_codon:yes stop_codon:yes gene_type:complete
MSKRYSKLIQKLSKYYIFLFLVYELDASDTINIEELLPNIEIVSTFEDRKKGLMFRQSISDDFGMFFIWEYKKEQCMWMKDTFIPLSLAYISNDGEIIDIYDMVPFSRKSVCSSKPVKYALEVNKNWFKENNISIGDTLEIKGIVLHDN